MKEREVKGVWFYIPAAFFGSLRLSPENLPTKLRALMGDQMMAQSSPQWPKMAQTAQNYLDGQKWRAISVSQYNPQNLILFILFFLFFLFFRTSCIYL